MKFIFGFAVFAMILAILNLSAEALPTILPSTADPLEELTTTLETMEQIRNKRDVMIYDCKFIFTFNNFFKLHFKGGCEGDACDRDCKGRNYQSGHCTPFALINERCWCVPK
uniref:Defensin n=1 Tax=Panagrolaimus davidi TaxID=227884 RepID=A0A914R353_9BILA